MKTQTQQRAHSPKRARSTNRRRPVKTWVLRDAAVLTLVYQTYEDLTAIREHCIEQVDDAQEVLQDLDNSVRSPTNLDFGAGSVSTSESRQAGLYSTRWCEPIGWMRLNAKRLIEI